MMNMVCIHVFTIELMKLNIKNIVKAPPYPSLIMSPSFPPRSIWCLSIPYIY